MSGRRTVIRTISSDVVQTSTGRLLPVVSVQHRQEMGGDIYLTTLKKNETFNLYNYNSCRL